MIHIVTVCRVYSYKYIFDFLLLLSTWFDSVYNIIEQFRLFDRLQS